jgi:hypothetical protein
MLDKPRVRLRATVPSYRQMMPAYVRITTAGGLSCVPTSV